MIKILFVCHGNICRSAAAEMVFRQMLAGKGLSRRVQADSAATSSEELGNDIYPPMKRALRAHGIECHPHAARRMVPADYDRYDLIIGMDDENMYYMRRMWPKDPDKKLRLLMDYAGRPGREVADPWYTRDFEATMRDVTAGCKGLVDALASEGHLRQS